MKWFIQSLNLFLLFSIIFFLMGILLFLWAFDGMAIAVPFFTKVFFVLSFICFILSVVFFIFKKNVKVKIEEKK